MTKYIRVTRTGATLRIGDIIGASPTGPTARLVESDGTDHGAYWSYVVRYTNGVVFVTDYAPDYSLASVWRAVEPVDLRKAWESATGKSWVEPEKPDMSADALRYDQYISDLAEDRKSG